jgi:hypothetical protein
VGEILGWIALVLVISALGSGIAIYFSRALRKPEPLALQGGSDAAKTSYRLARRAIRALEHLVERDNLVPFLSAEDRKEIDDIIDEFDQL